MEKVIIDSKTFSDKLVIASEDENEVCGLMIGNKNHVDKIVMLKNVQPSPVFFRFSVEEYKVVAEEAINNGQYVIGIFHSHPLNVPNPSATDTDSMLQDTGKIWTIYSVKYKAWCSWIIEDGKIKAIETEIIY
jgi:proteasome lid subunit RPN8/RPN11